MVPVVKARGDENFFEKLQPPAEVCMHERGIDVDQEDVGMHRGIGESENIHRDDGEAAEGEDFKKMHARSCHPVHAFCRVVHGVKSPEPWEFMKCAMNPVLDYIGEEHDGHELNNKWQGRDPIPQTGYRGKSKD